MPTPEEKARIQEYKKAVEFLGGIPQLAIFLGINTGAIYAWKGLMPRNAALEVAWTYRHNREFDFDADRASPRKKGYQFPEPAKAPV